MTVGLKGFEGLRVGMMTLRDRGSKKACRAGIAAGLQVLVQAERMAINAAPVSADLKAAARRTIGKKIGTEEALAEGVGTLTDVTGKAGFGVGKQGAAVRASATMRNKMGQGGAGYVRGVGISSANIHWAVLGTNERHTSTGHFTGKMPAGLANVIDMAVASSQNAMLAAARAKVESVLMSEASKH